MGLVLSIVVIFLCLGLAESSRAQGWHWAAWLWTCGAALNIPTLVIELLRFKGLIP